MPNFILMICDHKLDIPTMSQISGLSFASRIEEVPLHIAQFIESAYQIFDPNITHIYCYRLYAKSFPESAYLLGFMPLYLGRYNKKIEKQCFFMGMHIARLTHMIEKLEDLYKHHYKSLLDYCGHTTSLTYQTFIQFRKEVRKDCAIAKRAARKYFRHYELQT